MQAEHRPLLNAAILQSDIILFPLNAANRQELEYLLKCRTKYMQTLSASIAQLLRSWWLFLRCLTGAAAVVLKTGKKRTICSEHRFRVRWSSCSTWLWAYIIWILLSTAALSIAVWFMAWAKMSFFRFSNRRSNKNSPWPFMEEDRIAFPLFMSTIWHSWSLIWHSRTQMGSIMLLTMALSLRDSCSHWYLRR